MKTFLISPFKSRLKVLSLVSLMLVIAWYALLVVDSIDGWKAAGEDARIWRSGQKVRCERLFTQVENEVAAIDKGRCEYKGDFFVHTKCQDADKRRRAELVQATTTSGCPSVQLGAYGDIPYLGSKHDPDSLPIYALESRGLHLPILPAAFLCLTAVLLLIGDFAKRVVTERHAGWRRLTIVGSIVSALVAASWWMYEGENIGEVLVASIATFCIVSAAFIYGRTALLWIADGFAFEKRTVLAPSAIATQPVMEKTHVQSVAEPAEFVAEPQDLPASDIYEILTAAPFWPRLWARCIDLTLCWFIGSISASILPDFRSMFPGIAGIVVDLLTGMVFICGAVFLYEWQFISHLGATPGKLLFRISVSSVDGGLPTSEAAKRRAWVILKSGLYFCFYVPLLQLLGAIAAWRRMDKAQPWDMAARTFTGQKPIGIARFVSAALLAFCMFMLMVGISRVTKEFTKEEVLRSVLN